MKIGIIGGTFDPIHNGHLLLGDYAYQLYKLDEVWFMPNGNPPHKENSSIKVPTEKRVEMVKRAIRDIPYFSLQTHEVDRREVSYSYQTMEYLRTVYPEYEFYFIIGADSLFSIEDWMCPERLLKTCTVLAAYRDKTSTSEMLNQIRYINQKYKADVRLLDAPNVDVSSSEIRQRIQNSENVSHLLPERVKSYIETENLYRKSN